MKKNLYYVLLAALLAVSFWGGRQAQAAEKAKNSAAPAKSAAPAPVKAPAALAAKPLSPEIEEALKHLHALKEKGLYLDAVKAYEELLLEKDSLPKSLRKKLVRGYERLNEKLLFSRTISPDTTEVTVVEGDAIYLIAKKNGTTSALTKKINGLTQDTIYPGMKLKVVTGKFFIRVDKSSNTLRLFLNDKPVKTYSVATGRDNSTPTGEFVVQHKLVDPTWYRTGAVIPPGSPENGLGTRWLGLDHPGYGIHGTTEPGLIGRQVSHGCVRMRNADVEELYDIIPYGTKVAITD